MWQVTNGGSVQCERMRAVSTDSDNKKKCIFVTSKKINVQIKRGGTCREQERNPRKQENGKMKRIKDAWLCVYTVQPRDSRNALQNKTHCWPLGRRDRPSIAFASRKAHNMAYLLQ